MVKYSTTAEGTKETDRQGKVEEYQGTKLATPIVFTFDADLYASIDEAKSNGDWPNEGNILKSLNKARITSAKAAAYQLATKPLKEAYEKSPAFLRKNFIDSFEAMPHKNPDGSVVSDTEWTARANALADQMLGKA